MTYRVRSDVDEYGQWTPWQNINDPEAPYSQPPKPRLDWLLLLVLTLDLGVWVGLLTWWIWR